MHSWSRLVGKAFCSRSGTWTTYAVPNIDNFGRAIRGDSRSVSLYHVRLTKRPASDGSKSKGVVRQNFVER